MSHRNRLPDDLQRLLNNQAAMIYLFRVHLYLVAVAKLIGVSPPTVGRAREKHRIPLFPQSLTPPDWTSEALTPARWQTVKLRAYAGQGRCPWDCPASAPCEDRWWAGEGSPGVMLRDCPVRFYFSGPPSKVPDLCDSTLTALDKPV
jgi:hypothetical protein